MWRGYSDDESRKIHQWDVIPSEWAVSQREDRPGYRQTAAFIASHKALFTALDAEIKRYYEDNKQPVVELRRKFRFKNKIQEAIKMHIKPSKMPIVVIVSGSTVSGIGTRNSDVDLSICAPGCSEAVAPNPVNNEVEGDLKRYKDQWKTYDDLRRADYLKFLKKCSSAISKEKHAIGIASMELVEAMVPIIKLTANFEDEGEFHFIESDLAASHEFFHPTLHNSRLIKGFCQADPRFAPLVTFIKAWGGSCGVRDGQHRRFNSYALTLLVIHFLQCGMPKPVLPNLQSLEERWFLEKIDQGIEHSFPHLFAIDTKTYPEKINFAAKFPCPLPVLPEELRNTMSLSELFFTFLCYYSDIDLHSHVIRIKQGRLSTRCNNAGHVCPNYERQEIYIEDPIDDHNPGRTVDNWHSVQMPFLDARNLFIRAVDPASAYRFPLLEDLTFKIDWKNDVGFGWLESEAIRRGRERH